MRVLPDVQPKYKPVRLTQGRSPYPGEIIVAHTAKWCEDEICSIHNPSNHHMKHWRQHWRDDREIMERLCIHGIGHPDPDDLTIRLHRGSRVHGCDGCCQLLHGLGPWS